MKKIVRLTESDLVRLVKRVIREQNDGIVGPNQEKENLIQADADARWSVRTKFFNPLLKEFTNKDYIMIVKNSPKDENFTLKIRDISPTPIEINGNQVKVNGIHIFGRLNGGFEEALTLNCGSNNIQSKEKREFLTNQDLTTKLNEKFCKTFTL